MSQAYLDSPRFLWNLKHPGFVKTQENLKTGIAMEVIGGCMERVNVEALFRIERRLDEEGLDGFKLILNGGR